MDDNRKELAVPFLPKLVVAMSIPLYLGYWIKHGLLPEGVIFAVAYAWAVISVVVIPVLCLVECWLMARTWIGGGAQNWRAFRWHATGLGIGLGAILAVIAVR